MLYLFLPIPKKHIILKIDLVESIMLFPYPSQKNMKWFWSEVSWLYMLLCNLAAEMDLFPASRHPTTGHPRALWKCFIYIPFCLLYICRDVGVFSPQSEAAILTHECSEHTDVLHSCRPPREGSYFEKSCPQSGKHQVNPRLQQRGSKSFDRQAW